MIPSELLATLRERGVELSAAGGQLRLRGDRNAVNDPALQLELKAHKQALLRMLEEGGRAGAGDGEVHVPPNRIPPGCTAITPELLPLVKLSQDEIDQVVAAVPGGAPNVQDVYPLAPLQEGLFFHHLVSDQGDVYLTTVMFAFDTRARLDRYARALQAVVDRHDILRTGVVWEGLAEPVQVVWRRATLPVEEIALDPAAGDAARQLHERFHPRRYRLDLRQAPLVRLVVARDPASGKWLALQLMHHLACDHTTLERVGQEVAAHLLGQVERLPAPLPFRDFVARARLGVSREEHEAFFRVLLGDVDAPTAPFGLAGVQGDGRGIAELRCLLDASLSARLRSGARRLGVSAASLWHLAYALVLARVSGRDDVVFGTVMFGRMLGGDGAERVLGMLINTLPVRIRLDGESVESGVQRTHELLTRLLRHEHAPLALAQRCSGVRAPAPLFSALLNYRHSGPAGDASGEAERAWEGVDVVASEERTNYPFALAVDDLGRQGFLLTVRVQQPLDPERIHAFHETAIEALVAALEGDPAAPLRGLDVLPAPERDRVLHEWNRSEAFAPPDACVHRLFEARAMEAPQRVAVVLDDERLGYGELNARANRLARHLRRLGVRPDARVAVCAERSLELVVGLLAVLKAGGAYVPLDPGYPLERLAFMLADAAPMVLLTHSRVPGDVRAGLRASLGGGVVVDLGADAVSWAGEPDENPDPAAIGLTPRHLAYVIYTSGSTGRPKGVMVEHRALANHLEWRRVVCELGESDAVLQRTALSFDIHAWEVWAPLVSGARLVLLRPEHQKDPAAIARTLVHHGISCAQFVPTLLRLVVAQEELRGARWRRVFSGGEPLDRLLAREVDRQFPGVLWNVYGPTEATIDATAWKYSSQGGEEPIPLGRPIANMRVYVLDRQGRPAPIGVAGEIHLGGAGVARGYLGRPELDAERFLPDPFAAEPGARMYRTGDLGRHRADGNLEFLGRNDHQVKVRGFRIELGEIEAKLLEHPAVREAVVLAREDSPGDQRLVAYVTRAGHAEADAAALRAHLSTLLPDYMVPAAFVPLEALPVLPNGKLDRQALPAPDGGAYASRGYEAPVGDTETALAGIWADVLKVGRVGRRDDFFELGGHSLLAVTTVERMRRAGLRTDVRALFAAPTLAGLAASVGSAAAAVEAPPNCIPPGCAAITPELLPLVRLSQVEIDRIVGTVAGGSANVQDVYPLAPLQEGILFHHLRGGEGDVYLTPTLLACDSRERLDRYARALQAVIDRHDFLRTAVVWEGLPEPVQVVWRRAPLVVEEFAIDRAAGDVAAQLRARFDPRRFRLDLRRAPIKRLIAAPDTAHGRWLLLELNHHVVGDNTTWGLVQREVRAHLLGRQAELPAPVPYRSFVAQARLGVPREEHERFFARMLGDVDEPTAPFGLTDVRGEGGIREAKQHVAPGLGARLRAQARTLGVSAASLCHLAWALALARAAGREDVVFGTVLLGRMQGGEGAESVLGMFVNTLPIRIRIDGEGVQAAVRRTHRLLAELLRHEHAPLALAQRCSAVPAPAPLFTALLNYRHAAGGEDGPAGDEARAWEGIELLSGEGRSHYPLSMTVDDLGDGFGLTTKVDASVEPERVGALMQAALESLAAALESAPAAPLDGLDVLPASERAQLALWNRTAVDHPRDRCLHELIEAQAARTPGAPAVVCEDEALGYAELNARANRLARYLRGRGVRPDTRVAICVERSVEMVVGLLAILKAGGAYVPLDPGYPPERLAYMLADSEPAVVLTHGRVAVPVRALLPSSGAAVCDLAADAGRWSEEAETDLERAGGASDLAYLIYTSGSTGRPKGAMNEHHAVVNRLLWMQDAYGLRAGEAVVQKTPFSFDVSVWELFWPLVTGATMVMARPEGHKDPAYLADLIQRRAVTTAHFVPSMLHAFLEEPRAGACASLTRVICSGEALPVALVRRFRERLPKAGLHNLYGPTEAAVDVTAWDCGAGPVGERVPIGRPIANTRMYVLDRRGRPALIGAIGELYIGGRQVGRGYLNRPQLTAERFLPDPFGEEPDARMYRTGDLGRYLPDGAIDFLGRNDQQVKIRGFRIELEEVEARLAEHPGVAEAVVVAREDGSGEGRLVAYVTTPPAEAAVALGREQVQEWSEVYDRTYGQEAAEPEAGFDTVGWNSSYTREPIPADEMREWLEGARSRIAALRPRRVLEIGCGTGMLLFGIAPGCEAYVGTDLSGAAIRRLSRRLKAAPELARRTELVQAEGLDFSRVPRGGYDTVVLNSVVQLFPGIDYLGEVIAKVLDLFGPQGHVFIGDVRHHGLAEAFHLSVQMHALPPETPLSELPARVAERVRSEAELLIAPEWFLALRERFPQITHVEVSPKLGQYTNEMSAYRYDVVLKVKAPVRHAAEVAWIDCRETGGRWEDLQGRIAAAPAPVVGLRWLPNPRVRRHAAAWRRLAGGGDLSGTVGALAERMAAEAEQGPIGSRVAAFCAERGWAVRYSWFPGGAEGEYHVLVLKGDPAEVVDWRGLAEPGSLPRGRSGWSNDPLRARRAAALPGALRAHLKSALPEYMVPADYVLIEALPRTPSGKLDRKALPAPGAREPGGRAYAAPVGELEMALARVWAEVLERDRVGRDDDFFELGGHSLLVLRAGSALRRESLEISMTDVFEHPTIRSLAAHLERTAPAAAPGLVPVRTSGTRPALFLVHELHGVDLYFPVLAAHLSAEVPVYGLRGGPLDAPQPHTMGGLAARLAGTIRAVHPAGPYRIAGWSFGGALAYEIARQLLEAGDEVEFLGLLDTSNPARLSLRGRFPSPVEALVVQCERDPALPPDARRAISESRSGPEAANFGALAGRFRRSGWLPDHLSHLTDAEVHGYCARMVAHNAAWDGYRPAPLPMPLHLFVAQEPSDAQAKDAPPLGWGDVVPADRLRVIAVPGNHGSMMEPPHVAALGRALTEALDEIDREPLGAGRAVRAVAR